MSIDQPTGELTRRGPDPQVPFGCPVHGGQGDQHSGDHPNGDHSKGGGSKRGRSKRGYFVPGLIALVVLAVAGGVANFGGIDHAAPNRLAGSDVETYLAQAIQTHDGLSSPPQIRCPSSEAVRAGLHFTCTWQRSAGNRRIAVTETDARGQFRFAVQGP